MTMLRNNRLKIIILTYINAPYRVDLFNELGKSLDLTVIFEKAEDYNRPGHWFSEDFSYFLGYLLSDKSKKNRMIVNTVIKQVLQKHYDLVILYEYSTIRALIFALICWLLGIPYFINCDGSFISNNYIKGLIKRISIKGASGFFASGNMAKAYLTHYGAKEKDIHYHPFTSLFVKDIYDSVASSDEKEKLKNKLSLNGEKIAISVGRFIPSKNFELLISVWKFLPEEFQLIIAGSGELEEKYRDMVAKLNLHNVSFPGFLNKEQLFEHLRASDLFVLPTESDTWGLVVNEAMACGLPVITTDMCIAGKELITNGEDGFLVKVGDANGLLNSIQSVLFDDDLRQKMSANCLKKINPYTYENVAKSHLYAINNHFELNRK